MKHNFIFEPTRTYHEQHKLPISPQNFDPLDKTRDPSAQKKPIFSITPKPRTPYESIFEVENSQAKLDEQSAESELKRTLLREMRGQLEAFKSELMETFSGYLKDSRNTGKISNEDIQEIRRQMLFNTNRFEEIQERITNIGEHFDNMNSQYLKEIEGLKTSSTFPGGSFRSERPLDFSTSSDFSGKQQLDSQFKALKQGLVTEVQNAIRAKGKSRLNDDVVGELKQIKHSFETDLKQNFDMINGRVKRAEENLNEIMRKKRDYMDTIRDEFLSSVDHQNTLLTHEINHLEGVVKSKCDLTQARAIVAGETSKRTELFRTEVEALRKAIGSNQEEIERIDTLVNRKLENLDYDVKRQFFEFQAVLQKQGGVGQQQPQSQDLERRVQKLSMDSEGYQRTIQQLRGQIEEISKVHKLVQAQTTTPSSQAIISRLESKIAGLQAHIGELEDQIRKRQQIPSQLNVHSMSPPQAQSQTQPQSLSLQQSPAKREIPSKVAWQRSSMYAESTSSYLQNQPQTAKFESIEPEFDQSYRPNSSRNSERPLQGGFNTDALKYHGDPKVKTIIDEFNQKKRQIQASGSDFYSGSPNGQNTFSSPYESPSKNLKPQTEYRDSLLQAPKVEHTVSRELSPNIGYENRQIDNSRRLKHAKILAQINYFINGAQSDLLNDEEDSEIYCNLDDDGYIFDENGDFVLDNQGVKVKLTADQIEKFNNNNMIE